MPPSARTARRRKALAAKRATYADPHRFAAGFDRVIVNGTTVLRDGDHTGALPGRTLRRQAHFTA